MIKKLFLSLFLLTLSVLAVPVASFAVTQGTTSQGWQIWDTAANNGGYRYGPASIINSDGSIDMWTAAPGVNGNGWDSVAHRKSTDGGHTWGAETIVLEPTPGTDDFCSTCDPGVVYFGGYYYIGYTSCPDWASWKTCFNNDVFVARSTSPTGPFQKWNGSGWGGSPKAFIEYLPRLDDMVCYGAGEPSFVVKDGTLYVYYTWHTRAADSSPSNETRVATVSASDPNWPAHLTLRGTCYVKRECSASDSTDVKYCDSFGKFIAVNSANRMCNYGYVDLWESTDGITFTPATMQKLNIAGGCHNAGLSGTPDGHINLAQNNFVSYAYGGNNSIAWWNLYLTPVTFTNSSTVPAVPDLYTSYPDNGSVRLEFQAVPATGYIIKYGTSSGSYSTTVTGITGSPYTISGLQNGIDYYFVVLATNASGDSAYSREISARPLNYANSPRISVSASSTLSGWNASQLIDSNNATTWSSISHSTQAATEWISVDTGSNRAISRVMLTPRYLNLLCYPEQFKIQVSKDSINWTDAEIQLMDYTGLNQLNSPYVKRVYTFKKPIWGRYVRIYATRLSPDGAGATNYFQLSEFEVQELPYAVTASSSLGTGWESTNLIDGGANDYSSYGHAGSGYTEWISTDMGINQTISEIRLKPRANGTCFPVDFKIQSSTNGSTWTDVPGQSYTNYPNPGNAMKAFVFTTPVNARYFRIYATKLAFDGTNYYLQLSEMYLDTEPKLIMSASSTLTGWDVSQLADNISATNWSSEAHTTANNVEWVKIDLGSVQNVSGISMAARWNGTNTMCFPLDFQIQYSADGSSWTTATGQSFTDYYLTNYNPPGAELLFPFESLVNARYIRIYATRLRTDGAAYYFQLDEVNVDNGIWQTH